MSQSAIVRQDRWQQYSRRLAGVGLALVLLDLLGLQLNFWHYPRWASVNTTVHWHTNLLLIMVIAGLLALHYRQRWLALTGSFLVLVVAVPNLGAYFWERSGEITAWLLPAAGEVPAATPAWVLLLNAVNLILLAATLLLITARKFALGQLCAAFLFLITYASLIGNLYNIDGLLLAENFAGVTPLTSLALVLLSLGFLLYQPNKGWVKMVASPFSGGMLARRTFTYFLLVAPLFIGFYLFSLSKWQLSPGLGILSLFIFTCLITLPITFYYLHRLNFLDAQLQKTHQELKITNLDLSERNVALNEALADVKAGNRELAVMTKEVLLGSQALEAKNKELSRLNQSLDYIVHMASHDLKTPVYNLELLLQELKQTLAPHMQASEKKLVAHVGNSIASLKGTIEGLTQIIKSQQLIIGLQVAFSLAKLIQEIKKELEREIAQSNAQIRQHLETDTVVFSRIHLRSVLFNLLSNALKYRASDRPLLINISTRLVAGGLELTFSDNGLGMSGYQTANLFTIYKRFHEHVDGSGIGLYLVKQTIENNGGRIRVESTEGVGTQFIIFLPQNISRSG